MKWFLKVCMALLVALWRCRDQLEIYLLLTHVLFQCGGTLIVKVLEFRFESSVDEMFVEGFVCREYCLSRARFHGFD